MVAAGVKKESERSLGWGRKTKTKMGRGVGIKRSIYMSGEDGVEMFQ